MRDELEKKDLMLEQLQARQIELQDALNRAQESADFHKQHVTQLTKEKVAFLLPSTQQAILHATTSILFRVRFLIAKLPYNGCFLLEIYFQGTTI